MSNSRNPRTLLFVVNELQWFWSHRMHIGAEAKRQGWHVTVAAPRSTYRKRVEESGFEVVETTLQRGSVGLLSDARAWLGLVSLYGKVKPAVVHHVTMKPALFGSLAARVARVPAVVNSIAGFGSAYTAQGWRGRAFRTLVNTAYRIALAHPNSLVIFQNPDDQHGFVNAKLVTSDRAMLIRGAGVDLDSFRASPMPAGVPLVVLPARMLRDKGVADFAAAAATLKRRGVSCRCILVGSPDPANPTSLDEAELRRWEAEGVLEWWGERTDMPEVMRQSSLIVLPSYREGLPKVLLEAAASARAIVTNDVPGCREVVIPGVNGLLVPPRNAAALADAIEQLIKDPSTLARMGEAGRALAEREFSQQHVAARTLSAYAQLHRR